MPTIKVSETMVMERRTYEELLMLVAAIASVILVSLSTFIQQGRSPVELFILLFAAFMAGFFSSLLPAVIIADNVFNSQLAG